MIAPERAIDCRCLNEEFSFGVLVSPLLPALWQIDAALDAAIDAAML